jgi:hypothetical protein
MRALLGILAITGCYAAADGPTRDCSEDRCEAAGSREELLAAIDGFTDPMARWLRGAAGERGTLLGDYREVVDGVGAELGCDAATERSFVVLSNEGFIPKPILARCADDAVAASQFLVAMVGDEVGIDAAQIHVASWDAAAGVYRRYATAPTESGELAVNVEPSFCLGCHAGPERLDVWVPLMNEMASPWSNWNAHPGFASQLFDEHLAPHYLQDPTYRAVTERLDSAASFEPIVRAGIARVTGARLKQRTAAPDLALAAELLRPLFCDESLNYVSEVHGSGELRSHAIVDDALRNLYRTLDADGGWLWLRDTRIVLPPPGAQVPVRLIPVRGESTLQAELGLVARGALDPLDALRVRALDWKHPVQSELRCGLFRGAATRIAALDTRGIATTAELVPLVLDEILTLEIDGARVPLRAASGLVAIPDASEPAAAAALATGDLHGFETSLASLGAAIEAHVTSFATGSARAALARERDRRACRALSDPTAPLYPDLACP